MNIIQLILVAVRGISVLTNNPALSGGSNLKLQQASELLALLGELLERGDEAHEELKEFTEVVAKMAEENRAPTPAEWQTLRDRSDAAHSTIQDAGAAAEQAEADAKAEEQRLKDEAEAEERRVKEEALKTDIARLNDVDLQAAAESLGINAEGVERETIEVLILEAKLAE